MREVPGSIPGTALFVLLLEMVCGGFVPWANDLEKRQEALLAQWLERAAVNRKVTGSIPVGSVLFRATIFKRGFRKTPRPGIEPGSSA